MPDSRLRANAKHVAFWILRQLFKLRPRRVVVYYQYPDFARKAEALADLFRRQGFPTEFRSGLSLWTRLRLRASPDVWVGFWNAVPGYLLPWNYVFLNAEPLNVKRWSEDVDWKKAMQGARAVWGYARSNAEFVEALGVPFRFVPFGYAPHYENTFRKHTRGKGCQQDIDVLFFGAVSERRRRMLDELSRRGMNVHVVSRAKPAYGRELDELLLRARIVLGIYYYEEPHAQIPDLARLDHLLSNQLFVIYEKSSASVADPIFEQHVTTCPYADIPAQCAYFLDHPEERALRAKAAHEWFKSEYALDAFIPYEDVRTLLRSS